MEGGNMKQTGLILVSHGEFAKAALASAEMIAGKQENVIALGLKEDTSLETMEKEVCNAYETLHDQCGDVIILCDIYGGTPFNAISRNMLRGMDVLAFTGLNLPLLIDLLLCRDIAHEDITDRVMTTHQMACQKITVSFDNNEEEELDL